jgi:hypothetical protein
MRTIYFNTSTTERATHMSNGTNAQSSVAELPAVPEEVDQPSLVTTLQKIMDGRIERFMRRRACDRGVPRNQRRIPELWSRIWINDPRLPASLVLANF